MQPAVVATPFFDDLTRVVRDPEPVLIPLLVAVYLVGRAAFAIGCAASPLARAFGMALTAAPLVFTYVLDAVLMPRETAKRRKCVIGRSVECMLWRQCVTLV